MLVAMALILAPHLARAQATACADGEIAQSFAFRAGDWPSGATGPLTFAVGGGSDAVTLTFSVLAYPSVPFLPNYPQQATAGGIANVPLVAHNNPSGGAMALSVTSLVFSRPVNKLRWTAVDVDRSAGVFQDAIAPRANGTALPTSMIAVNRGYFDFTPGQATANANAANCSGADPSCNITVDFNLADISSTSIDYLSGQETAGPGPSGFFNTQFIGWSAFEWCLPGAKLAKNFVPAAISANEISKLTFTLTNGTGNPQQARINFTDTLPAGVVVAAPPNVTSTCPSGAGVVAAAAGSGAVTVTGAEMNSGQARCTISVDVTSAAAGVYANTNAANIGATQRVDASGANATLTVTRAVPGIALSAPSFGFPGQTIGTISSPQTLAVTSIGTAPLEISGIGVAGDFALASTCTAVSPLAPGTSCAIDIAFSPLIPGARTGGVVIASNATGDPVSSIALAGLGVATSSPNLSLMPASLVYPPILVGHTGAPQRAKLTNTGGATLTIDSIAVAGSAGFSVTHDCGPTVAPGGGCTFTAAFTPPVSGIHEAQVRIASNAPGSPSWLRMAGTARPVPAGRLAVEPASLAFKDQMLLTTSKPKAVTLANIGDARISFAGTTVTGDFALEGNTCVMLEPGESCAFDVKFTPTRLRARTGQVLIATDAENSPIGVGLGGNGVSVPAPRTALSLASIDFGNVLVGIVARKTVTVINAGSADLVFAAFAMGSEFSVGNLCAGALAPGDSCAIEVIFAPSLAGQHDGMVRFVSNAGPGPEPLVVTGVGCRDTLAGYDYALACRK